MTEQSGQNNDASGTGLLLDVRAATAELLSDVSGSILDIRSHAGMLLTDGCYKDHDHVKLHDILTYLQEYIKMTTNVLSDRKLKLDVLMEHATLGFQQSIIQQKELLNTRDPEFFAECLKQEAKKIYAKWNQNATDDISSSITDQVDDVKDAHGFIFQNYGEHLIRVRNKIGNIEGDLQFLETGMGFVTQLLRNAKTRKANREQITTAKSRFGSLPTPLPLAVGSFRNPNDPKIEYTNASVEIKRGSLQMNANDGLAERPIQTNVLGKTTQSILTRNLATVIVTTDETSELEDNGIPETNFVTYKVERMSTPKNPRSKRVMIMSKKLFDPEIPLVGRVRFLQMDNDPFLRKDLSSDQDLKIRCPVEILLASCSKTELLGLCIDWFENEADIEMHVRQRHPTVPLHRIRRCNICRMLFLNAGELHLHLVSTHYKAPRFGYKEEEQHEEKIKRFLYLRNCIGNGLRLPEREEYCDSKLDYNDSIATWSTCLVCGSFFESGDEMNMHARDTHAIF